MGNEIQKNYRIHYKNLVINIWAHSFEIDKKEELYRFFDKENSIIEIPSKLVDSFEVF